MRKLLTIAAALLMLCGLVQAIPMLQLDISPGLYDTTPVGDHNGETTIATSSHFTLYALIDSMGEGAKYDILNPLNRYYISAAIIPSLSDDAVDLGTFDFAGETVGVTSGMVYGTPANLPPHGIFDTYYKEFSFSPNSLLTTGEYNTQDLTGLHYGPTQDDSGKMYYVPFDVNVDNLATDFYVHFDLYGYVYEYGKSSGSSVVASYDAKLKKNKDTPIVDFVKAPFSHDGESDGTVPDGGATVALLGLAVVAIEAARRRL
jgi:hypothetical protein